MSEGLNVPKGELLGHPKGLFLLFSTEMWERVSYYGMRALLVLSMVAATESANPGFGWSHESALKLYAWYTGAVYYTPVIGGWLADNLLGERRAVIIGALVMAIGQFTLSASFGHDIHVFYAGLVMLVAGNGLFKANISTMVGQLYAPGDARRDSAFSIFYMGINLGGLFGPLICSTFGENPNFGWKYGYMAAGCGMTLSALIQIFLSQKFLGDLGRQPSAQRSKARTGGVKAPLTTQEKDRVRVIFMLFIFVTLFWASFEQGGGLMNFYASEKIDRMLGGFEIPAGWFQSVNSLFIIVLAPVIGMLWVALAKRGKQMPTPIKMMSGLLMAAVSFLFMVGAVFEQQAHGKANMLWLVMAYFFVTVGELCISPVGLSMVTKLAPLRLTSVMMGVWLLTNSAGNLLAGYIGAYAETAGELTVFVGLVCVLTLFAALVWLLSGKLVDWMHGAEEINTPSLPTEPSVA